MIATAITVGRFIWRYRKLAGYAAGALAVALLAWRIAAWRAAYTELATAQESLQVAQSDLAKLRQSIETANNDIKAKDTAYTAARAERDVYASQVTALLQRPQIDPKSLIIQVPTNAPVTSCPDRGTAFRLHYNAIVDGTAATDR